MPLPYLEIQNDNNSFLSAVVFATLFPVLHDDELFETRFLLLFGQYKDSKMLSFNKALLAYSLENTSIPLLNSLIKNQLRPRIATHIADHRASFLTLLESDEALNDVMVAIETGAPPHVPVVASILSTWLACTVRIYENHEQTSVKVYPASSDATDIISILQVGSHYHSLIDIATLSEEVCQKLQPCLKKAEAPRPTAMVRSELIATLHNERFNRLLQTTFSAVPKHLESMHAVYSFYLVSHAAQINDIPRAKNIVYFQVTGNSLTYFAKSSLDLIEGVLTEKDLNYTITESFNTDDLMLCRPTIVTLLSKENKIRQGVSARPVEFIDPFRTPYLTQTEGRVLRLDVLQEAKNAQALLSSDHVKLLPHQPIGRWDNWGVSMVKSAAVSAVLSTARFDIVAVVTMLSMGSIEIAPLAMTSLPFFLICFSLSMGTSAMGKHYAIKYEVAIRDAKSFLDVGDYVGAIKVLDHEFSRWFGARSTRHSFLTNDHYAMAHFLRGTCAIIDTEHFDYQRAYVEFDAAAKDAKKANNLSLLMITQLQKISLLKTKPISLLSSEGSSQQVIDNLIVELSEFFPNAFSDLYWKFNDKIAQLAQRLLDPAPWTEHEIAIINQYLITDATYMLRHFSKGRGQFMEVFFSFFQSSVLAYIHQTNLGYLKRPAIVQLEAQLNFLQPEIPIPPKEFILCLAVKKLRQCAEQLQSFKKQQPALFSDPDIVECVDRIKEFAKGLVFHAREIESEVLLNDLAHIVTLLTISDAELTNYMHDLHRSTEFLADLSIDFNQNPYPTIEDLLDAIIASDSPLATRISPTTGDTILHRLAALPRMPMLASLIHKAARCLLASIDVRNHRHETPIFILRNTADPHGLLAIIDAKPMIKLGKELDAVDAFLKTIKTNPAVDSHFLLLDGPPGTGKTTTVQDHLKSQGYTVRVWVRGTEQDSRLGGILTRISKFFSDAKTEASASNNLQILFIDEIDRITPLSLGGPTDPQYHNKDDNTATFQTEITRLKGHNVVVIGATNFPAQIAKAMLSRAGTNRLHFPLPDEAQRIKLLNFFFRAKAIDFECIVQLAKIAVAYSPRELQSFVDSIKEVSVTQEMMIDYFNQYALTLTRSFKEEFQFAELFMPSFEKESDFAEAFSTNAELAEQMIRLQSDLSSDIRKHTLLYGPPGSGKTTAVRIFAQTSGRVLITVQADERSPKDMLQKLFERAKQLSPAIIFFDEMHNIAQRGTQHGTFIQTEMDGMTQNNITIIGATNYPERFEAAILSRFTSKIELPKLSAEALGQPIKKSLLEKLTNYEMPVYLDSALANELNESPTQLSIECEGLSLRDINAAFGYLMCDLRRENTLAGITYLRLQDVCFSILRMKIQEKVVARPVEDMTNTAYIHQNRLSFFPATIPEGSAPAPRLQ